MALDNQSAELFGPTPFQTLGPFFHYALPWRGCADLLGASTLGARPELMPPAHDRLHLAPPRTAPQGEAIRIIGRVTDGLGQPVPDALIEIWQADASGRLAAPQGGASGRFAAPQGGDTGFIGFGRCATQEDGGFTFLTIRPGSVQPGHAPHIAVGVLARGILRRLATRLYFAGDPANDADPVLAGLPAARRATLLAHRRDGAWVFDIALQGPAETVFFQI